MPRVCEVSGKRTRFGKKLSRRGMAKSKGGVGIKLTGITSRTFRPNIQKVRVLLPDGTVRRMKLAASVIRTGWITVKIKGKMQRVPLVKAVRGRNKPYKEPVQTPPQELVEQVQAAPVAETEAPTTEATTPQEVGQAEEAKPQGEAEAEEPSPDVPAE